MAKTLQTYCVDDWSYRTVERYQELFLKDRDRKRSLKQKITKVNDFYKFMETEDEVLRGPRRAFVLNAPPGTKYAFSKSLFPTMDKTAPTPCSTKIGAQVWDVSEMTPEQEREIDETETSIDEDTNDDLTSGKPRKPDLRVSGSAQPIPESDIYTDIETIKTKYQLQTDDAEFDLVQIFSGLGDILIEEKNKISKKTQKDIFVHFVKTYETIKQLQEENRNLRLEIDNMKQSNSDTQVSESNRVIPSVSYASKVANGKKNNNYLPKGVAPRQIVIIESKNQNTTAEQVKKQLVQHCAPAKEKLRIKKTIVTKNNKIAIECDSKTDAEKLISLIKNKPELTEIQAAPVGKLQPRIIIKNVPEEYTKEDIAEQVSLQNNISGKLKAVFSFKAASGRHWILQSDPNSYHEIMRKGRLYLGFSCCKVENYIKPMMCNKCCRLGHTTRTCSAEKQMCAKCGGEHLARECKSDKKSCVNCTDYNKKFKKSTDVQHSAYDSTCPCIIFHQKRLVNKTDYDIQ